MPRLYRTIDAQTQIDIISEYQPGQRGKGLGSLARKYSFSKATVENVIKRAREHGGDPSDLVDTSGESFQPTTRRNWCRLL
jgi:Mor family transcriptional regulator